jgi:hypothetical protein
VPKFRSFNGSGVPTAGKFRNIDDNGSMRASSGRPGMMLASRWGMRHAAATFMAWTGGATWPISLYLIALAVITLIATMAAPETARKPLR